MTDTRRAIGIKIRMARKFSRLTLKQLSQSAGLSVSFLSEIERGHTMPSLHSILALARALGTEPISLIEYEPEAYLRGLKGKNLQILDTDNPGRIPDCDSEDGCLDDQKSRDLDQLINELADYILWSEEDRKELLCYLKAKRLSRFGQRSRKKAASRNET